MSGGDEALLHIFAGTLSADKSTREQAEAALARISADPQLIIQLIHFSCEPCLQNDVPAETRQARHAASIRVRNVLGRSDWNRQQYFTEEVKSAVRNSIVPLQCGPRVPELVRRQLLAATQEIIRYDFPQRWPTLIPQLRQILDECVVSFHVTSDSMSLREAAAVRLKGALDVLRACCKAYENPLDVDADAMEEFVDSLCPSLVKLTELLVLTWTQEVTATQQRDDGSNNSNNNNYNNNGGGGGGCASSCKMRTNSTDMFFTSSWHVELSHCLRIAFKCFDSLFTARWPHFLCSEGALERLCKDCIGNVLDATHRTLLPLCRQRILANDGDDSDLFSAFHDSAVWKLLKWVQTICLKLLQELMLPGSCERRARAAAKHFCDHHLLGFVQQALDFVRWHATPRPLTSKAYIMALEILTIAVGKRAPYRDVIAPHAGEIFTSLIFPRLAFSGGDAELWTLNPVEYVRLQTSPAGDLYSAKVVSAGLMLSLAVPSKPFHDTAIVNNVVQYVLERLEAHAAAAARGDTGAARVVDAALFTIYQFSKVLQTIGFGDEKVEWLLTNQVTPAMKYPIGFLRARSVLVLSVFAPKIQWSSPSAFQHVLSGILPLLQDPELPVRMQTCTCFSSLICHPYAWDVIAPCISDIVQHYFNAMRLMDNEGVVRTLRKTIKHYRSVLSQWALQLTEMLVQHFDQLLRRSLVADFADSALETFCMNTGSGEKKGLLDADDDGITDSIMAADEVLVTLTTLVRALPAHPMTQSSGTLTEEGELILRIQERIAPMLYCVLSKEGGSDCFGFMDASLMLLTTTLSRSSAVAPQMWQLVPCLHQLVLHGAVDYFDQMLPPLDNLVCVAPSQFLLFPMRDLCAVPEFALSIASMTPAQVVCTMCDAVLNASHSLRLRELSPVPKIYDAILQNLWKLGQREGAGTPHMAADSLVEYIIRVALRVLGDPASFKRQRRTLTMLFANSVLSAMLANAALTVRTLLDTGALAPFFAHYVQLVQGEDMPTMLRSYDRRLCVMAVAALARLLVDQPGLSAAVDEVLCGFMRSDVLTNFSHREGVLVAMEAEKVKRRSGSGVGDNNNGINDDDEEEEEEDDEWSGDGEEESNDDVDDYDEDEMDVDDDDDGASTLAHDGQLRSLLTAAASARGKATADGHRNDDDDEEEEEDNLLDESDFISPIDASNAWAFFLDAVNYASAGSASHFCQLVKDVNSQQQMQSIAQMSSLMEQLMLLRERRQAA